MAEATNAPGQPQIPPQLQEQLKQFQNLQQQLQVLAQQKAQYELQGRELKKATEALHEAAEDTEIYRSVGSFLVKTKGRSQVLKEIEEESETLGVRLKNIERQEARSKESLQELQSKIQAGIARLQGGQARGD
jgi:prefoldin beta subunit